MDPTEIQEIMQILIPITGIVFGTLLVGYVFGKIVGLIKAWINRKGGSYDDEKIDRMAKAFIKHKKDTERRLQNLEAILTDEESPSKSRSASKKQLNKRRSETIEIDERETDSDQQEEAYSGNLKNMLNKKREQ